MPEIPNPGYGLDNLGRGLEALGGSLMRAGARREQQRTAAQQAALNAQSTYQYEMATATFAGNWAEFEAGLSGDPETYVQQYDEWLAKQLEEINVDGMLPAARQKWGVYIAEQRGVQRATVIEQQQADWIAKVENDAQRTLWEYAQAGDVGGLTTAADGWQSGGVLSSQQLDSMDFERMRETAIYNRASNALRSAPTTAAALAAARSPDFAQRFGLSNDAQESLVSDYETRLGWETDHSVRNLQEAQSAAYDEWNEKMQQALDPDTVNPPSRNELLDYQYRVGPDRQQEVKERTSRYLDYLDSQVEQAAQRAQEANENQIRSRLLTWNQNPEDLPISMDALQDLRKNERISQEGLRDLEGLWQDITSGAMGVNAARITATLYDARGDGDDPRLRITDEEILARVGQDPAAGGITAPESERLIALRDRLGIDWDEAEDKGATDPYTTTTLGELAALRIATDLTLTPQQRRTRIYALTGAEDGASLSPNDSYQWGQRVEEYTEPQRRILRRIQDAFQAPPDATLSVKKELSSQEHQAVLAMDELFRRMPDNESVWNEELNRLLGTVAERKITDQVENLFGDVTFPGRGFMRGNFREERRLELLRERGQLTIAQQAEFLEARERIDTVEGEAIEAANLTLPYSTIQNNSRVYSSQPIRYTSRGTIDVGANGDLYEVRTEIIGNTAQDVVYRLNTETKRFDIPVR